MNFRRQRRQVETLEMTPLIDVIFQLLIFFLLTTTFVTTPGISIDRPSAQNSSPLDSDRLTVVLPKGLAGSALFQGERMSYAQLREALKKVYAKNPNTQIAIDADQTVEHKVVVRVMDLIEGVGFRRIGIVTSPSATPSTRP